MRAAPSSVSIQIGAAVLPFVSGQPITDTDSMVEIFQEMDFYVRHQYNAGFPPDAYDSYDARRQIASDRMENLTQGKLLEYLGSIGVSRAPTIGITEWNMFLNQDHWHINRTLEGGVFAMGDFQLLGFTPSAGRMWRLSAESYEATNDRDPTTVILV